MFTFDPIIDLVEKSQKSAVNTFVVNKEIAGRVNELIDMQNDFARNVTSSVTTFATKAQKEMTALASELARADYTKTFGAAFASAK